MHPVSLDAHAGVAVQTEGRLAVARVEGMPTPPAGVPDAPVRADVRDAPVRRVSPVIEHRLADHLDLDLTLDALDHPDQDVIGVEISRRAGVARRLLALVPLPDRQRVGHDQPALRGHPGRLEDVRARQIAPARGHIETVWADAEAPRPAVEHRGEDTRGVEVRDAHPLDRAVRGHQRTGVAVGQEGVVRDRRERRGQARLRSSHGRECRDRSARRRRCARPGPPGPSWRHGRGARPSRPWPGPRRGRPFRHVRWSLPWPGLRPGRNRWSAVSSGSHPSVIDKVAARPRSGSRVARVVQGPTVAFSSGLIRSSAGHPAGGPLLPACRGGRRA